MKLVLLGSLLLVFILTNGVEGKANGKWCRKGEQCDSGHCCKLDGEGFGNHKKCVACCTNADCPSGQQCLKNECSSGGGGSTGGGDGNPNGIRCKSNCECENGVCCGVWPNKKCRDCCDDQHCEAKLSNFGKSCCQKNQCFFDVSTGYANVVQC